MNKRANERACKQWLQHYSRWVKQGRPADRRPPEKPPGFDLWLQGENPLGLRLNKGAMADMVREKERLERQASINRLFEALEPYSHEEMRRAYTTSPWTSLLHGETWPANMGNTVTEHAWERPEGMGYQVYPTDTENALTRAVIDEACQSMQDTITIPAGYTFHSTPTYHQQLYNTSNYGP